MEEISFRLEVFEGPLDLLLHLIAKNKVNIWDIPVAEILEQYMAYLDHMEQRNISLSGDFAAMAAQLMYIKSKMLLPRHEDEPEEDPRARLVEMLMEYQRIKEASTFFSVRESIGRDSFVKEQEAMDKQAEYLYNHTVDELMDALGRMTDRAGRTVPPPVTAFSAIVGREESPVSEKVTQIVALLAKKERLSFRRMLLQSKSRSELVAVFLAVLELSKDLRILINDVKGDYEITLALPAQGA